MNWLFATYADPTLEGLFVALLEGVLDVAEVDFAARDDNADQSAIFGSDSVHTGVEPFGEEADLGLDALHCNSQRFCLERFNDVRCEGARSELGINRRMSRY